jgi:hypothetical protein
MTTVGAFLIPTGSAIPAAHEATTTDPEPAAALTTAAVTTDDGKRVMHVGVDAIEAVHVTAWVIAGGQAHRLVDKHAGIGARLFSRAVPTSVPAGPGHVTVRLVDAQGNRKTIRTRVHIPAR